MSYTLLELLSGQPRPPVDGILSRTLYTDEQVKVVWFGFGPGQELSEHTASQPAILHILSGEAELKVGADFHAAHPGTWVHMPAQLPHSVQAKTELSMLLLLLKAGANA
jgi:quercetin dioxygenase-like cupin family protein